jgi:ribonucleoside-diphosphate reductase alpha chain
MRAIRDTSYALRPNLAAEKGAFPLFDAVKPYLDRPNVQAPGRRRADAIGRTASATRCLTSIAPTGTISLLAGQRVVGHRAGVQLQLYQRRVLMPDGTREEERSATYAYRTVPRPGRATTAPLPASFVDAQTLRPPITW